MTTAFCDNHTQTLFRNVASLLGINVPAGAYITSISVNTTSGGSEANRCDGPEQVVPIALSIPANGHDFWFRFGKAVNDALADDDGTVYESLADVYVRLDDIIGDFRNTVLMPNNARKEDYAVGELANLVAMTFRAVHSLRIGEGVGE